MSHATLRNGEGYFDPTAGLAIRNIERAEKRMPNIRRGDIFYIEKYDTTGSEQQAGRPALVVSNNKCNECSDTIEVVYLTTAPKNDLPTHVTIRSAPRESIALCEQVTTVSTARVKDFMCAATAKEMAQIDTALLISLDLTMGAPAAPQKAPEPPTPETTASKATADSCVVPLRDLSENVELAKENVRLAAQLEIYKGLYEEMTNRAMGRVANG